MVQYCCIPTCRNSSYFNKKESFHRFPKREELRKEWAKRCKSIKKINLSFARLCSIHFLEDDFERDLKNELLNLPLRKKLKSDAVPSLNLPYWPKVETAIQPQHTQLENNHEQNKDERESLERPLATLESSPTKENPKFNKTIFKKMFVSNQVWNKTLENITEQKKDESANLKRPIIILKRSPANKNQKLDQVLKNIDEQSKDEKESPKKRIIILKKFIIKKNTKLTEIPVNNHEQRKDEIESLKSSIASLESSPTKKSPKLDKMIGNNHEQRKDEIESLKSPIATLESSPTKKSPKLDKMSENNHLQRKDKSESLKSPIATLESSPTKKNPKLAEMTVNNHEQRKGKIKSISRLRRFRRPIATKKTRKLDKMVQTVSMNNQELEIEKLKEELFKIKSHCSSQSLDIESLKKHNLSLFKSNIGYRKRIRQLSKDLCKKPKKTEINRALEKILSTCFTPGQIKSLLNGNKRVKWQEEDISRALILKTLSENAYVFLKKCNIPLPCLSTLERKK